MYRSDGESVKLFLHLQVCFRDIDMELRLLGDEEFEAVSHGQVILRCRNLSTAGGFYRCIKEIQLGTIAVEKRGVKVVEPVRVIMDA